ncbi:MAG: zf-HC2 domain-containing protein, partial [bacterium]
NCKKIRKLIVSDLDGALPVHAREKLAEHLSRCPRCSEYRETMEETFKSLRTVSVPQKTEHFWNAFQQAVSSRLEATERSTVEDIKPRLPLNVTWRPSSILAPAMLLIAVIGVIIFSRLEQHRILTVSPTEAEILLATFRDSSAFPLPGEESTGEIRIAMEGDGLYSDEEKIDFPSNPVFHGESIFLSPSPSDIIEGVSEEELELLFRTLEI